MNDPGSQSVPGSRQAAAYIWDLASDRLEWDEDPSGVLGVALNDIATGRQLETHLSSEHRALRRAAISGEPCTVHGTPYHVRFSFLPAAGAERVWLDEIGRTWPDAEGRPARARGNLRRTDADFLAHGRLLAPRSDESAPDGLNRSRLLESVGARLKRAERTREPCALLMASVNGMEAINAHLGFDIGDEAIAAVGHLLKAQVGEQCAIYRYASNTLAIIEDLPDPAALETAAATLIAHIRDSTIQTSAGPLRASLSVGGVALPLNGATVSDTIANALDALEIAKKHPQGAFIAHDTALASHRARRREHAIPSSLVAALESDRLLLALQPIVDAATGKPVYFEGLLRLRREDGTLVPASEFVADAEKLGLARLLDMRALDLGLSLLEKHTGLTLSLNVSSLTAGDPDWLAVLTRVVTKDPTVAGRLIVEITETAMIHDIDRVAAFVDALHKIGCKVAIDDFGAGFTSFRFLKTLKVDVLKIDGMFVSDLAHDEQGLIIVKTMIDMAKALKLETVAEWVADETTRDVLRAAGATYLQGYLFGKPILAEDAERTGLI